MSKEIELAGKYIVLEIPEDTVSITITAQVYLNGGLQTVERKLGLREVREAFREAEEGYLSSDATFEITEEGRRYLDSLEALAQ